MTVIIYFENGTFIRFNNVREFDDSNSARHIIFTDEFGAKVVFNRFIIAGYSVGKED
jgi:hypothetical protein